MSVAEELETEKEKVRRILEEDEQSRNSDKRLYAKRLNMATDYFIASTDEIERALKDNLSEIQGALGKLLTEDEARRLVNVVAGVLRVELNRVPSDLDDLPNWLTVRRVRAEIQNEDGELLPTDPEVAEMRNIREEKIREYYGRKREENR